MIKHADLFDNEFVFARNQYHGTLRCFNLIKSDFNRITLFEKKRHYKQLINKKKKNAYKQKMLEIAGRSRSYDEGFIIDSFKEANENNQYFWMVYLFLDYQ